MTCVWCYAHTLVISAIGYTDCSLFSYIENTNLLPKELNNLLTHVFDHSETFIAWSYNVALY